MMKKIIGKHEKKKLNNQGFTLLELIIAMIVIAIVITPFLHSFMTSLQLNSKSRYKLQASTVAQDVMEGLKTEIYLQDASGNYTDATEPHLASIMYQFAKPTISTSFDHFFILPPNMLTNASVGEIPGAFGASFPTDRDYTWTDFQENTTDYTYYMYLMNVKQQDKYYDVLVTLDGSAYMSGGASGQEFNAVELVQIPNIDRAYDAVCTNNYDAVSISSLELQAQIDDPVFHADRVERLITIDILSEASSKLRITAKYDYTYKTDAGRVITVPNPEVTIFYGDKNDFRNVYLYFYPMYGSTAPKITDKIVLNNNINSDAIYGNDPYEFELFLIKQQDMGIDNTLLKSKEKNYRCYVTVKDNIHTELSNSPVTIRTNLGTNLYSVYDTTSNTDYSIKNQAIYFHNNLAYSENDAKTKFGINVVTNKGTKTAYLDSNVKVYKHFADTTPSLADFNSQTPLAELDGSFMN